MLTADLVHARRHGTELRLVPLGARRARALELAEAIVAIAREHVGRSREELEDAWSAVDVAPGERKLFDGLCKLVEDALVFEVPVDGVEPAVLRAEVFALAAAARRAGRFDRDAVLSEVARARGLDPAALERGLYADLKGAHVLRELGATSPLALVQGYDLAQAQAVMLRATHVRATLSCADPAALRALLRKLKFLRLLHTVHREPDGAHRLEIDGPFSLFESVTKYGLALAMALPAITACGSHEIVADVRWGKQRTPLTFRLSGTRREGDAVPVRLCDDAEALRARLAAQGGADWRVAVADAIFELPGIGACVPDLAVTHLPSGRVAWIEVMGYWSRDAVWKRVQLVERGLREPILFCVSERLRVREDVLPAEAPAALFVYKGVIPAAAVLERLATLLGLDRRGRG